MPGLRPESPAFDAVISAPFGALGVRIHGGTLIGLEFLPPGARSINVNHALIKQVADQLDAYYANPAHRFTLPLAPRGTPYRLKVWQALAAIPAGHTETYGSIAHRLGSGPRAVGQAVGDNPLPIIIPCHRVIAANGGLGGFMHSRTGYSQVIKRWLLQHEHVL
jgi:methylated-DNA-[protein]-cysteine S-methyltransferase